MDKHYTGPLAWPGTVTTNRVLKWYIVKKLKNDASKFSSAGRVGKNTTPG